MSAFCPLSSLPISAAELAVQIHDASDQAPLPGATVAVLGTGLGGHADEKGYCRIKGLPAGHYDLLCSHIGYQSQTLHAIPAGGQISVALATNAVEVPEVVISAVRRSQAYATTPISIAVAEAHRIAEYNTLSLVEPLRQVAGVSQVGGQLNIRGSSGFSRGTGSRILMLVDGFPLLSADLGDIKWDAIPLAQVERVEVVKGAGSALYGTGALGGVINVLTRDPGQDPSTRYRLLSGYYSQPAYRTWRWSDGPMYLNGFDLSHNRRIGETGMVLSGGHNRSTGYHQNGDARRYHLYAKAVHHFSPTSHWRTMANWAFDEHGVFVQWRDRDTPLAVPVGDGPANTASWKLHLNSEYYRLLRRDLGYRLKVGYYRTGFENNQAAGGLASDGHKLSGEGQVDYAGLPGWIWTVGVNTTSDRVRSPGDFLGARDVLSLASYAQGVREINEVAELTAGLRYDWNRRAATDVLIRGVCGSFAATGKRTGEFSPQVGFSYRPWANSAIRASLGRGFRAPSVSEVFAQAQVSGLKVCPNPDLGSERVWSYEVGFRQAIDNWLAFDGAFFWNDYWGLIEGRPDLQAVGSVPVARFQNLSRARVRGVEGEVLFALPYGLGARGAYTFVDGVEYLAENEVLPPHCHGDFELGGKAPLPYRSRHAVNAGLKAKRGASEAMLGFQYLSAFDRVSGLFPECGRDQVPIVLANARLSRRLGSLHVNLRIDNIFQYHYATIERKIRPLRRFSLSIDGEL